MTTAFIDTHVHLYPVYPLESLLDSIHHRIQSHSPEAACYVLMLTERSGDQAFESFCSTGLPNAQTTLEEDQLTLRVHKADLPPFHLISGKQMATAEKMEVLALGTRKDLPDGLSLIDSVVAAREAGAFPVIPWAPGKWMFKRKALLDDLIDTISAPFALSDSAMRFTGFPTPGAFSTDFPILAGTDPLPHAGEDKHIGRYGITMNLELHQATLPQLIKGWNQAAFEIRGHRRTVWEAATAQFKHMKG